MPKLTQKQEHARDARDLRVLSLLDQGYTQPQAANAVGMTRGPVARLVAQIRDDEAAQ